MGRTTGARRAHKATGRWLDRRRPARSGLALAVCAALAGGPMLALSQAAQAQAVPGSPECPLVDGVVTCSGDVGDGVRLDNGTYAPHPIEADELRLVNLTTPIITSNQEAVWITNLDLHIFFDQTVDIQAGRWGGVTLEDGDYTLENNGSISLNGYENRYGAGGLEIVRSSAAIINNGRIHGGFSGTLGGDPEYGDPIDAIYIGDPTGPVSIENNGEIERNAYNGALIRVVTPTTSGTPLDFTLVNNGSMTGSAPVDGPAQYANRYRPNALLVEVPQFQNISMVNTGFMDGDIIVRKPWASPVGSAIDATVRIDNAGTIGGNFELESENEYGGCEIFADSTHRNCPIGDASRFGIAIDNRGEMGDILINLDLVGGADIRIRNTGTVDGIAVLAYPGENSTGPFDIRIENAGPISGFGAGSRTYFGRGSIDAAGWSPITIDNSGNLTIAECAEGEFCGAQYYGIRAVHVVPYAEAGFGRGDDKPPGLDGFEQVAGIDFQSPVSIRNTGAISVLAPTVAEYRRNLGIRGISQGALTISNSGAIGTASGIQVSHPEWWSSSSDESPLLDAGHARSAGIMANGWTDIDLTSAGTITVGGADGVGIDFGLWNVPQYELNTWQPIGFMPGYDRAADLAGQARLLVSADITAAGDASVGIFGDIGRRRAFVTPARGEHVFEHDDASAQITIRENVTVRGGSGVGSGVFLQGAGDVTLDNAGTITSAGNADSGAVVLGARTYNERYNYRSIFDPDETDELAAYVIAPGLTLDLVDSVNSGMIVSAEGHGILVANGAIGGFVNSGTVRGGAGAISSSGRGEVANNAAGVIDGAVVLSGAGSVLTNSGLVRLAGTGAQASLVNGDWVQSSGRLELGLDDTLAISGDMHLAGELGVTLGAPSSTGVIRVGGDLALDAVLDVTGEAGFGEGVYRLFDYGGLLSGDGLAVGTMPDGTSGTVQTAIAGQVNLVVGGGVDLPDIQFWDGVQTTPNGAVDGGSATWDGTISNWTGINGDQNDAWGSRFAVFQGAPGTVTIASGGVSASGLQFAVDGYRIEGGTLTLTAPATLRVGDASAAGSAYVATIASTIAGSGGIDKTDLGTLVLTGSNIYAGGTRLFDGVLQVASDAALGAASGAVDFHGGTLRVGDGFDSARAFAVGEEGGRLETSGDVRHAGTLSGSGAFSRVGDGRFEFAGDGSGYSGSFGSGGGTFQLSGTLGGLLNIAAGATLAGTGSAHNLRIAGRIAPGNSIGTLSASGDVSFLPGSVFEVEVAADGGSDLLDVAGAVDVQGGTVEVVALDPQTSYVDGSSYTFLRAGGGLTGTFDALVENSAFLDFTLGYSAGSAFLTLAQVAAFPDVALTFNQRQASTGLRDLAQDGDALAAYNALLVLDADAARDAFDASSGEIHAGNQQAMAAAGSAFNRGLLRQPAVDGPGLWLAGAFSGGQVDGDGNAAALDHRVEGLVLGFGSGANDEDGGWYVGGAIGSTDIGADVDGRASRARGDAWHAGVYGGVAHGALEARAALGYMDGDADVVRGIDFGALSRQATATQAMDALGLAAELAWTLFEGPVSVAPLFTVDAVRADFDAAQERGADALDLTLATQRHEQLDLGLGVRLAGAVGSGAFELRAVYLQDVAGDRIAERYERFAGSPTGFVVHGPEMDKSRVQVGAGLQYAIGEGIALGLRYEGLFSGSGNSHGAGMRVDWRF